MTDFERMYASLAHEVDDVVLVAPDTLRRGGDRRTRIKVVTTVAVVAALVAGTAVGGRWMLQADASRLPEPATSQTSGTPQPSPSSSPPASPTATPEVTLKPTIPPPTNPPPLPVAPSSIPDSAFLHVSDTNGQHPVREETPPASSLPRLCGAKYPSGSSIKARRAFNLDYWFKKRPPEFIPDTTFHQTIATYRGTGGPRFLQEVRDAVRQCPKERIGTITYRYRIVSGPAYGDESIWIEARTPARDYANQTPLGYDQIQLGTIVRIGNVVTVLWDTGYESSYGGREEVDTVTRKATARLRTWLRAQ